MKKIKVFFSYDWDTELNLRNLIEEGFKQLNNVELIVDKKIVDYTHPDLYVKIRDEINRSHCVLVSLSSMNESIQVACELTRANSRFKEIIIIEDIRKNNESVPNYLSFLSNKLRLKYENESHLIALLKETFQNKTTEDFEKSLPNELFQLVDNLESIYLKNKFTFRKDLTKNIINEAREEISNLYRYEYNTNVGIEKNFLIRAKPIFENATKVYAVSVDQVSTFWEKTNNEKLALEYIKSQPKDTIRLFVFSSAKDAHRYVNILQAHHSRYGEQGRVYLCSRDSYKKFIDKFILYEDTKYLYQDFGILFQKECEPRINERSESSNVIEAILTDTQLSFRFIELDYQRKFLYRDFLLKLDSLRNLTYEKIYEDQETGACIKRWNPECLKNTSQWKNELKQLFPEPHTGEAYHCVCFKNNFEDTDKNIRDIVLKIKDDLEQNKKELGINSIWFGRQAESNPVFDAQFKGKIKISNKYNYLLLIRFKSQEEMEQYYEKKVHGSIRSDLYSQMDRGLKFLCDKYAKNSNVKTGDKAIVFEEIIEEIVSKYMIRHDFLNIENIDKIVFQQPIPFNYENLN